MMQLKPSPTTSGATRTVDAWPAPHQWEANAAVTGTHRSSRRRSGAEDGCRSRRSSGTRSAERCCERAGALYARLYGLTRDELRAISLTDVYGEFPTKPSACSGEGSRSSANTDAPARARGVGSDEEGDLTG